MSPYSLFSKIKGVILDIDGVCTNNRILVTDQGEFLRTMNVRDGYAIKKSIEKGIQVGIISGGKSEGTRKRFELLGVKDLFLGVSNKAEAFVALISEWKIPADQIAYMGDDCPDISVLKMVGLPSCPADAVPEVIPLARYISPMNGGDGCVRDLLEKILQAQGLWDS